MRDSLPQKPRLFECAIVNIDREAGQGTHWVAYKKCGLNVQYFDSFGSLTPPLELIKYFSGCVIKFNHDKYQRLSYNCGHLCLEFLYK